MITDKISNEAQGNSINPLLSVVPYQSTWTTCTCGKIVELQKNSMGWKAHHCGCGTKIRQSRHGGVMIVER